MSRQEWVRLVVELAIAILPIVIVVGYMIYSRIGTLSTYTFFST